MLAPNPCLPPPSLAQVGTEGKRRSRNKKAGPATRFRISEIVSPHLGASTITIWRPSERGWLSTLATDSV